MSKVFPMTVQQFQDALPPKVKKSINQELIDSINATLSDPEMFEQYRNNLLSYSRVMNDGRFKVQEYIAAVKYCSHKLMGATNIEAYSKTFPDKIIDFTQRGVSSKDQASYCSAYNKSKLVQLIMEQTMIPVHVLNMDMYQKALNAQFDLGMNAQSEKVRADALNSVLTQLRPPEIKKVELDIGVKEDGSIAAMRQAALEVAAAQRQAIAAGVITAQDAAHSRLNFDVEDAEVKS
jgi:hypothetical protein